MKKILLSAGIAASLITGAGFAVAEQPANPGENGHCTAFFNGEKEGHDKQAARDKDGDGETDGYPGPFQDLQDRAPDGTDPGSEGGSIADLYDYCQRVYGIMGNGGENGRFDGCWTNEDQNANTHNCDDDDLEPPAPPA